MMPRRNGADETSMVGWHGGVGGHAAGKAAAKAMLAADLAGLEPLTGLAELAGPGAATAGQAVGGADSSSSATRVVTPVGQPVAPLPATDGQDILLPGSGSSGPTGVISQNIPPVAPPGNDPNWISSLVTVTAGGNELKWTNLVAGKTTITYSYWQPGEATSYAPQAQQGGDAGAPRALTAAQQAGVDAAMAAWEKVANVDFVLETSSPETADLRYGFADFNSSSGAAAYSVKSFFASGQIANSEIWYNDRVGYLDDQTVGGPAYTASLHEIGHSLNFKHPFSPPPTLSAAFDHDGYSVMSYTNHPGTGVNFSNGGYQTQPESPMLYDVAAMQYLYGANTSSNTGNDTYAFGSGLGKLLTIWDAGGTDTIDASAVVLAAEIDLREGQLSGIGRYGDNWTGGPSDLNLPAVDNIGIAFGVTVENAKGGSGNDTILGNAVANLLEGNGGNDTITPGAGADTVSAGANDDNIVLSGGDGSWSSATIFALNEFMARSSDGRFDATAINGKLQYHDLLDGGIGTDTVTGSALADTLFLATADEPIAGGNSAVARLAGIELFEMGDGDDVLDLTSAALSYATSVTARGGNGKDYLWSSTGNDTLEGGDGADYLAGSGGNDSLRGNLAGGAGDGDRDIFGIGDIAGAGTDTVLDFEDGVDVIRLAGFNKTAIGQLAIAQTGSDVTITVTDTNTATLILSGFSLANLSNADFMFA